LSYSVYTFAFIAVTVFLTACKPGVTEVKLREVTVDLTFTQKFLPKGDGFTGSDGTYSIELPNGKTVWIFGDTFIGNVTPDNRRLKTIPTYIRNSFVMFEGDQLITYQQGKRHEFKSMMIPPEVSGGTDEKELWYWPGDGFVLDGKLNVFVSKFSQKDHNDMWAFNFLGTELLEFSLPDFKPLRVDPIKQDLDSIHYGHAVLESKDYLYIYGLKKEFPYVARAEMKNVRQPWEFYNGSEWVRDAQDAAPILEFSGSEQFSVFEWKGTYVMIMQEGHLGRKIYSFTSNTPYGPWKNQKLIYETPRLDNCPDCWTYNALAHPQFIEDETLLVSYNTNSMKMQDHYDNALIYRPRFVRVPLELILNQ
jgi:hypothetical protein